MGSTGRLTLDDARPKDNIPRFSTWGLIDGMAVVIYGNQNWNTAIVGSNVDLCTPVTGSWKRGACLPNEIDRASKVTLIGPTLATELFGDPFAIGEEVGQQGATVIGLLETKGQDMRGIDQDDILITPVTTPSVV